jgi:lipopolysaccharide export system protein LptA
VSVLLYGITFSVSPRRSLAARRRCVAATIVSGALAFAASPARAQGPRQCLLDYESPSGNTRTTAIELPSKKYNVFQGGGVIYRCRGQDNTIIADSSEYYGDQSVLYLLGNVHYRETRAKVDSDRMIYYQLEDRLRAEGNVNVLLQSGTTMRGPVVDYYRVTPSRPLARAVATGHPTMRLVQRNPAGQPGEPVNVVANQIVSEGENLLFATGSVEITRPDVVAKGDSAFVDSQREFVRLMRSPSIESKRDHPFTLRGGVIDLFSRNRILERVLATPDGHALSRDLELVADSVDLRMSNDKLERLMAWGKNHARAISPDREITADSIDAIMPGERLREVRAVRNAYANTAPDTAHYNSTERDWMRGDVIVAEFDSIPAADTSSRPRPRRIVATGNASSYYQIAGNQRVRAVPNINYVKGKAITVLFVDRAVSIVDVVEQASGVYIEPSAPAATPSGTAVPSAARRTVAPPAPLPAPASQTRKIER